MSQYILYAGLAGYSFEYELRPFEVEWYENIQCAEEVAREKADDLYAECAGDGTILSIDETIEDQGFDPDDEYDSASDLFWDRSSDWVSYKAEELDLTNLSHLAILRDLELDPWDYYDEDEEPGALEAALKRLKNLSSGKPGSGLCQQLGLKDLDLSLLPKVDFWSDNAFATKMPTDNPVLVS